MLGEALDAIYQFTFRSGERHFRNTAYKGADFN